MLTFTCYNNVYPMTDWRRYDTDDLSGDELFSCIFRDFITSEVFVFFAAIFTAIIFVIEASITQINKVNKKDFAMV